MKKFVSATLLLAFVFCAIGMAYQLQSGNAVLFITFFLLSVASFVGSIRVMDSK